MEEAGGLVLPTLPALGAGTGAHGHAGWGDQEGSKLLSSIPRAGRHPPSPSSVCAVGGCSAAGDRRARYLIKSLKLKKKKRKQPQTTQKASKQAPDAAEEECTRLAVGHPGSTPCR